MTAIQLVAGLGNPGSKYERTRHNAGFWFVDAVARRFGAHLAAENRFKSDVARCSIMGRDCGHNGLRDLIPHLGGNDFLRLRVGIGHPGHKDAVTGYVLKAAPADELQLIESAIDAAVEVLPRIIAGEIEAAMKELHTKGD